MKKNIIILTVAVMVITLCTVVFADAVRYITAEVADYTIKLNSKAVEEDISVVTIDGRAYVPVRALGEVAGFGVNWNEEESTIEISTGTVPQGYQGIDEWKQRDLQLTKENALVIGDEVFHHIFSEEYINATVVNVWEPKDENYYDVWRTDKDPDDPYSEEGCVVVRVRKSDGKIMALEFQEN